jgi:hypothetical protein
LENIFSERSIAYRPPLCDCHVCTSGSAQPDLLPTRNAHDGGKMSHYALYAFLKNRVRDGDEFDAERYAELHAGALTRFHGAGALHHFVARGFDAGLRSCWVRTRFAKSNATVTTTTTTTTGGSALRSERRDPLRFCL